jgi:hypothetical protein
MQLAEVFILKDAVLYVIRALLSLLGAYFFFVAFISNANDRSTWLKIYLLAIIPLAFFYLFKPSQSVLEGFYMTIHRVTTTPILAMIMDFAYKYKFETDWILITSH